MVSPVVRFSIYLSILVAMTGLCLFGYMGFYNRYWADDWCFNVDFEQDGIVRSAANYFVTGEDAHTGYPPNRYSFVILSGLFYLTGLTGTQILPALTILLWLGSLIWMGSNINRLQSFTTSPIIILASALLLFYTLYLSPQRFQILYWRSGVLPYSWSIIFGLMLLAWITNQLGRTHASKANPYVIAPLAFVGAGFSEIGSALLFSGFTVLLLAAWWGKRNSKAWAQRVFSSIRIAWLFVLLGLIALVISPSNARYADLDANPGSLLSLPFVSLRYALLFLVDSLVSLPVPHAVFFATFVGPGALWRSSGATKSEIKSMILLILLALGITLLLVAAIQAPTAYLYTEPPDPRGQSLSRFVILLGLATVAWCAGRLLTAIRLKSRFFPAVLLLLFCSAYTAQAVIQVYGELPGFIERARAWDKRDLQIRDAIDRGITRVEITAIDTREIGTRDIIRSRDFGEWVTDACGVEYYGAEAMRVAP